MGIRVTFKKISSFTDECGWVTGLGTLGSTLHLTVSGIGHVSSLILGKVDIYDGLGVAGADGLTEHLLDNLGNLHEVSCEVSGLTNALTISCDSLTLDNQYIPIKLKAYNVEEGETTSYIYENEFRLYKNTNISDVIHVVNDDVTHASIGIIQSVDPDGKITRIYDAVGNHEDTLMTYYNENNELLGHGKSFTAYYPNNKKLIIKSALEDTSCSSTIFLNSSINIESIILSSLTCGTITLTNNRNSNLYYIIYQMINGVFSNITLDSNGTSTVVPQEISVAKELTLNLEDGIYKIIIYNAATMEAGSPTGTILQVLMQNVNCTMEECKLNFLEKIICCNNPCNNSCEDLDLYNYIAFNSLYETYNTILSSLQNSYICDTDPITAEIINDLYTLEQIQEKILEYCTNCN